LTLDEAYWSYSLYLHPKLTGCTSITQQQCKYIQASALAALPSKMHLNHHTPHAVLFSESRLGGLSLPDLYTDQGHYQLKLLIGHLKLKDRNGDLINIDLSNVQLVTGAILPFFSLPYSRYAKWINWDWIVSIWKYTSHFQIVVDIENMWTPLLVRDHDISLMDSAI
jgi:hypothetical protein